MTGELAPAPDYANLRREFLLAGIADTQGTIHANDSKCSAALIVHGLLFAGLLGASVEAAKLFPDFSSEVRIAAVVLAAGALIAAVVSIVHLLIAVRPYRPEELVDEIEGLGDAAGIFYTEPGDKAGAVKSHLDRVNQLDEDTVRRELTYEAVKLGAIRDHEAGFAKRGYNWLIGEVAIAIVYLVVLAAAALETL